MDNSAPRAFEEWRKPGPDRADDAAYAFGYYLIKYCRDKVLEDVLKKADTKSQPLIEKAVDHALHNFLDMIEGYYAMEAGPNHDISFKLMAVVDEKKSGKKVEEIHIGPGLDLPIGYWKFKDHEFR